jgi:diacylglycerol kinase family enzyme
VLQGFETVVACGGDGTVSAVASALVGTEAALGVLPFGTLNHFAKDLHIPLHIDEAVRVVARRKVEHVDVGEVNGTFFVNNSSIGIYPNIVIERERRRSTGWNKWIALGAATLHVLRRYPFMDVCIRAGGHSIAERTPFVFVGNNEYQIRGLNIGRRDALNLGRLYLYVAAPVSRARLIRMAIAALFGRIDKTHSLQLFSLPEAWIDTPPRRVRVSTDGEVRYIATPLHYVLRPRALKVIVP